MVARQSFASDVLVGRISAVPSCTRTSASGPSNWRTTWNPKVRNQLRHQSTVHRLSKECPSYPSTDQSHPWLASNVGYLFTSEIRLQNSSKNSNSQWCGDVNTLTYTLGELPVQSSLTISRYYEYCDTRPCIDVVLTTRPNIFPEILLKSASKQTNSRKWPNI